MLASSRDALSPLQLARVEQFAFEHGESYDSYLVLDDGKQFFFGSHNSGVVGFTVWRNHLYVVGGLLAATAARPRLLAEFLEFARRNSLEISFLNVLASDRDLFRSQGFQVSKVGEEPILDLPSVTWQGRDYEWVRRQENYCLRQGVTCNEEFPQSLDDRLCPEMVDELYAVSDEHVKDTVYGRELSMVVGKLDLDRMFRKRLFVARREDRIEAFVVAIPSHGGRMWSIETFRRRPSATRGIIPYLFMQVARRLKGEGVDVLSLCQVPALRVDTGTPSDSRFVTQGMRFWWNHLPWFYDPPRLYHFKSRFRPQYRECFVADWPRTKVLPLFAFFFQWGVVIPDLARLPMQMLRRLRKWGHRECLADPSAEKYVLVNELPFQRQPEAIPALEVRRAS